MTPAEWFKLHGVHVFPVNGKEPAVPKGTSWQGWHGDVARLSNYAVALSAKVGVLDTDDRDGELWTLQQIANRVIPNTPFFVDTARGKHRYFQLAGPLPKFIHRDGHTLELRNEGQYVVGPGSRHPSGVIYRASDWSWRWEDVPYFPTDFVFDDRPLAARGSIDGDGFTMPARVYAGERHDQLFRLLRSCKGIGFDEAEAREIITMANQGRCDPPLVEDEAFEKWIRRAWRLRDRPFPPRDPFAVNLEAF